MTNNRLECRAERQDFGLTSALAAIEAQLAAKYPDNGISRASISKL